MNKIYGWERVGELAGCKTAGNMGSEPRNLSYLLDKSIGEWWVDGVFVASLMKSSHPAQDFLSGVMFG